MKSLLLYALLVGGVGIGGLACQLNITGSEPSVMTTGLEGWVLRGPMCPGPQTDQGCPDQPFSAWFDVFDDQEKLVTRFQTDEDGLFEVELRPGVYTLVPDESAPIIRPHIQRQTVTVQPDEMTTVILNFDTGIR